jgi:hyaluronan synthase
MEIYKSPLFQFICSRLIPSAGAEEISVIDIKKVGIRTFTVQLVNKLTEIFSQQRRQLRQQLNSPVFDDLNSKCLIVFGISVIIYCGLVSLGDFKSALAEMRLYKLGSLYLFTIRIILLFNLTVFIWRLLLVAKYKPVKGCSDKELPKCTVIVPAYNEGKQVLVTIQSIVASDYPAGKLQIIAVDDGSRDDTFKWMETACNSMPGRIECIRQPVNRGKREALFEGIMRSRGRIIVTIDSDSTIEPDTLRNMVSPFVKDKTVGAVAGNVRVLNASEGVIPKMLDVSFAYSFEFLRASQSMVDTVFCTPGALSAYRKDVIMKNLKTWLNQTFMGRKATIGEDRAMTNMILNCGWAVRFQSNAIVYTNVPTEYRGLCKMFLRWARSNVRETLAMGKFVFKKFRSGSATGARVNFITSCLSLVFQKALIGMVAACMFFAPQVYLSQLMFGTVIASTAPAIFYVLRRKDSDLLWAYAYGLFWLAGLWWITPWAMLTARNGKWLTRQLPQGRPVPTSKRELRLNLGTAA